MYQKYAGVLVPFVCGFRSHLIPYIWMPKWIDATDPSARTLKHYKDSEVEIKTKDDLIEQDI